MAGLSTTEYALVISFLFVFAVFFALMAQTFGTLFASLTGWA